MSTEPDECRHCGHPKRAHYAGGCSWHIKPQDGWAYPEPCDCGHFEAEPDYATVLTESEKP